MLTLGVLLVLNLIVSVAVLVVVAPVAKIALRLAEAMEGYKAPARQPPGRDAGLLEVPPTVSYHHSPFE